MRAIVTTEPGGPEVLTVAELPDPTAGPGEVVIDVAATAVNRADVLQRKGFYPPPPGASDVIGLECSGTVAEVGEGVTRWHVGDEVCALLAGGGYAEKVLVPEGQVMSVPAGIDLVTAAALPEVACTVWSNVFLVAGLRPDETLLVHGGAGGIGTFAIQVAHEVGARVITTAGSAAKLDVCRELGADVGIDYREQDFVAEVKDATAGRGADVILDNMGASYLDPQHRRPGHRGAAGRHRDAGRRQGRARPVGRCCASGPRSSPRRCARARPENKAVICAAVEDHVWPMVAAGTVQADRARPVPARAGRRRPPRCSTTAATSARSC